MEIPKEIEEALDKRAEAANNFVGYDAIIHNFLAKNNIDVDMDLGASSVLAIYEPYTLNEEVRQAILEKDDN